MAATDGKQGLAIRSEQDGTDARVQIKIVDYANPGTQQAIVDTDHNVHVELHGNNPTGADTVQLLSEEGAVAVDGVYNAGTNSIPATTQVVLSTRSATVDKTKQNLRQTGVQNGTVITADVSLYDELGAPFTQTNPLPVSIQNAETGTALHKYNETAAVVAPGTPQSIIYSITTTPLMLKSFKFGASHKMKIEFFRGVSGTPIQMYTWVNTEAKLFDSFDCPTNDLIPVGEQIQVTFTSLEPTGTPGVTGYVTIEGMQ